MISLEQIKARIAEKIQQSGLSQAEIAKALNIGQPTVAHYVKGDKTPRLDTLANLCKVLNVSPSYILYFDE